MSATAGESSPIAAYAATSDARASSPRPGPSRSDAATSRSMACAATSAAGARRGGGDGGLAARILRAGGPRLAPDLHRGRRPAVRALVDGDLDECLGDHDILVAASAVERAIDVVAPQVRPLDALEDEVVAVAERKLRGEALRKLQRRCVERSRCGPVDNTARHPRVAPLAAQHAVEGVQHAGIGRGHETCQQHEAPVLVEGGARDARDAIGEDVQARHDERRTPALPGAEVRWIAPAQQPVERLPRRVHATAVDERPGDDEVHERARDGRGVVGGGGSRRGVAALERLPDRLVARELQQAACSSRNCDMAAGSSASAATRSASRAVRSGRVGSSGSLACWRSRNAGVRRELVELLSCGSGVGAARDRGAAVLHVVREDVHGRVGRPAAAGKGAAPREQRVAVAVISSAIVSRTNATIRGMREAVADGLRPPVR